MKIAFVIADSYEDSEFRRPYDEVKSNGHDPVVIGEEADVEVSGKQGNDSVRVEKAAEDVRAEDFDALVIAGGYSPDKLRTIPAVVQFVRAMFEAGKPVAAICHAASLLIEADVVKNRRLTSWPSVSKDVENAGGQWTDREVVIDDNLITSRKPDDLDAFCRALLEALEQEKATAND